MENFIELFKLGQIILVDLVLAGDNAIVIGLVAAKFTAEHRRRVILYGVGVAVLLRIVFAVLTVQLLAIPGLLFVGGVLLLWICWKLWSDLRATSAAAAAPNGAAHDQDGRDRDHPPPTAANPPLLASIMQVAIADLSMSLDNVLAVVGIADDNIPLLVVGLAISVAFMTFAAALIANTLQKHRWLGYAGLAAIVYVGVKMTIKGAGQLPAIWQV